MDVYVLWTPFIEPATNVVVHGRRMDYLATWCLCCSFMPCLCGGVGRGREGEVGVPACVPPCVRPSCVPCT